MTHPLFGLLGQIIGQIWADGEEEVEARWYEVYDKLFNYVVSRMVDKDSITVAPQWSIQREALEYPVNLHMPKFPQREAERFLADLSMEANTSLEGIDSDELSEKIAGGRKNPVGHDKRIPDFVLFRIKDHKRQPLFMIELKSESHEILKTTLGRIYAQARIQAQFAFERWPDSLPTIWTMMIRGTLFCEHQFKRAELEDLPHHKINKNKHLDHELDRKEISWETPDLQWKPVFAETQVRKRPREDGPVIKGFSDEFKTAMNTIVEASKLPRVQWERQG